MSQVIGFGYIRASPDSVLGELSRGMSRLVGLGQ